MLRRRTWLAAGVAAAAIGAGGWWWVGASRAPHGNIEQALRADVAAYDDQQLLGLVSGLDLEGSTKRQRIDLFTRLKARFDAMPLTFKLGLLLAMRKQWTDQTDPKLMANGRLLMQAYWNDQVATYMKLTPEERKKMLDQRIDETLVFDDLQKVQDAAKGLFGGKPGPSEEDLRRMRTEILNGMVDSLKNGAPDERAGATEFFTDMRNRRLERGLPVAF